MREMVTLQEDSRLAFFGKKFNNSLILDHFQSLICYEKRKFYVENMDKININYEKMDNGHGPVAHSPQVLTYSTE